MIRKLTTFILTLCTAVSLSAQVITDGSHWFDGSAYYTAAELEGSILFSGASADGTYEFEFRLSYIGTEGHFKLDKAREESIVPFRTDYGTIVRINGKGNATTLSFLNDEGLSTWTLVKTDKSHRDCLATEFWAKSQPLEKMMSSYIMNTHYLSVLSKTQLRYMQEVLKDKQNRSHVEQNNLELITSELKVPDFQRINVGDLQALSEADGPRIVTVTTETEFLDALRNGTTIHLPEGTRLNLTKVLTKISAFKRQGRDYDCYLEPYMESKACMLVSERVYDGNQLSILNLKNVTIHGDGDCHIVVDPAYAFVLNFIQCENIRIENVTMGHTVEGYCTGGVIGMNRCKDMTIEGCDLYGCGAYGLVASDTDGIIMRKSIIRDCSYGIMELYQCQNATFRKCNFYRNREFGLVNVYSGSKYILFDECRFYENKGLLFYLESKIQMKSCGIVHNDPAQLGEFGKIEQMDENTTIRIENY